MSLLIKTLPGSLVHLSAERSLIDTKVNQNIVCVDYEGTLEHQYHDWVSSIWNILTTSNTHVT